jgi:maltose alpha-D-glucosyltransferase/alpha-amylase
MHTATIRVLSGMGFLLFAACRPGPARAQSREEPAAYVRWLEERSMLHQAARHARAVSGSGVQWRHAYAEPQPRQVVRRAGVWLLDYPGSVIPRRGQSVLATWADPERWRALQSLGIELLHIGPVKRAGAIVGRKYTPTTDGWFDPIGLEVDPDLGTEEELRRVVREARRHGALLACGLVPLHTGKGADFRLAQRAYRDYPGLYTMVEVRKEDWGLLPAVDSAWATALVPKGAARELTRKGYLPGLINSNDAAREARTWSGWSATGEVVGVDGKPRRWVYLHYFKPDQPTLNWLDPSFAAQRAVGGDITWTVHGLGARVLRFDAVPFLALEREGDRGETRHYQHGLSVTATDTLAALTRKLGGWSFHELNVPLENLTAFTKHGPDLSYDFFTRAQCLHALLTGDAAPLRQAFGFLRDSKVSPGSLVHDLQNHDEITYQLVELDRRKDEAFKLGGKQVTGKELRERMLKEMREQASGPAAPHNLLYRPEKDGLATTFAAYVAAGLGVRDPYRASATERDRIRDGHLLLAAANALQPGVFSLSTWDLVGALPIPEKSVADRVKDGDYRWVNRGGVDLMGVDPGAKRSALGLERAKALYGPLPAQLEDPKSFASRLRRLLAARKQYRIAEAEVLAVPEGKAPAVCLLVLRLPGGPLAVTALNFGRDVVEERLDLTEVRGIAAKGMGGEEVVDILTAETLGRVSDTGRLKVKLAPLTGTTLVIRERAR